MKKFKFEELDLRGAYLITPFVSEDIRGEFVKDYEYSLFMENGIKHELKEVFYSTSKKGTVRGMHFQYGRQQTKLVRCISGRIYDVIVDLRKGSPTYRQWRGFYLDDVNMQSLYVPKHFAHGFMALEESVVSYKCDEEFYGAGDSGIKWNDEDLNVEWPIELIGGIENIIISDKDKNLQTLKSFEEGELKNDN